METIEKYARICTATGKGINEGFCVGDGAEYFKEEKDLVEYLRKREGAKTNLTDEFLLKEAYDLEEYYYTEWEIEEGENYFDEAGNEYDENNILVNDLFDNIESLSEQVKSILDTFKDNTYQECQTVQKELNQVGYTFEYYLDAEPFNLKKL